MRRLEHRCRDGRTGELKRDTTTYDVPVWRCQAFGCKTYFLVVDGELNKTETG